MPIRDARAGVRVERINCVVHGGHHNNVVFRPANGDVRDPEWLRINGSIGLAGEQFAERGTVNVCRGQRVFGRIGPIARQIIVVGVDAFEIGHTNCGGHPLRNIARLRCSDGVGARSGRSRIDDAGSRGAGIG